MAGMQDVNEEGPFDFIMHMINQLNPHDMRNMIRIGYEVLINPLIVLLVDMEIEDVPIDEPAPVEPRPPDEPVEPVEGAVVVAQEVQEEDQHPQRSFRIFVTKNLHHLQNFIIVEMVNPNDPYMFTE